MLLRRLDRRHSGELTVEGEDGAVSEAQTLTCIHCSGMWVHRPGSGIRRGFCLSCNAVTCGSKPCDTCDPFERKMERAERRARLHEAVQRNYGGA